MENLIKTLVPGELVPALNPHLVTDGAGLEKLKKFIDRVANSPDPVLGADYETNITPDFYWRKARTLQLGNKDEQHVIDFLAFADGNEQKLCDAQGGEYKTITSMVLEPVLEVIGPVLANNKILKVGANLRYEYEVSRWCLGIRMWHMFSVDIVEKVIQAGLMPLKQYALYSLEALVERYFHLQIDKSLQTSFDLKTPLTPDQIIYAALDTRMPLAVRQKQLAIMSRDNLTATAQIENDSIGVFADMHINGQRINSEKWLALLEKKKTELAQVTEELDNHLCAVVGRVSDVPAMIVHLESLTEKWATAAQVTSDELNLKLAVRKEKDPTAKESLKKELAHLELQRKERKDAAKIAKSIYSKNLTKIKKVAAKAQGKALINLNSGDQIIEALLQMRIPGVTAKTLTDTSIETLEKFQDKHPVIKCLMLMRGLAKSVGTYGLTWVTTWTTKPCKDEGFLHPGDGRLHSIINQLDTETGRTSSEKPNGQNLPQEDAVRECFEVDPPTEEEPEGFDMLTLDMSGAELRIIAEAAQAQSWIQAFAKGWDVHSVSTEILYPAEWPAKRLDNCAYFTKDHKKCKCPEHETLRGGTKSTNFLLCYGGTADALATAIGKPKDEAQALMELHERKFPDIWSFLRHSGEKAVRDYEARDMFGRRRLFLRPSLVNAEKFYREKYADRLILPEEEQVIVLDRFREMYKRKPTADEKEVLLYSKPNSKQLTQAFMMMKGSIERRGKNMPIQGTNASIAKRAFGCGFDKDGKPYLWHVLPQFKAKALNFVHDEILIQTPKRFTKQVAEIVQDSIKRAAAEVMKTVVMESEYHISHRWQK